MKKVILFSILTLLAGCISYMDRETPLSAFVTEADGGKMEIIVELAHFDFDREKYVPDEVIDVANSVCQKAGYTGAKPISSVTKQVYSEPFRCPISDPFSVDCITLRFNSQVQCES